MAPVATVEGPLALDDVFKMQNERVAHAQFDELGQMEVLVLGGDVGQPAPPWAEITGRSLDWYGTGPMLAVSKDGADLLVTTAVPHPPEFPDPRNKLPMAPTNVARPRKGQKCSVCGGPHAEGACRPNYEFTKPPTVEQLYRQVTAEKLKGSDFLLFQPVELVHFVRSPIMGMVEGLVNPSTGRHLALFIDPKSGEAHFVGRFRIKREVGPRG